MLSAGIDIGSVAAKAVLLDTQKSAVAGFALASTSWNARETGEQVLACACANAGARQSDIKAIVATGYGRVALPFATKCVTEITCHACGACRLFPRTGLVIDVGGQDSKVIATDQDGSVADFVMNDKCAAGTGRFLQVLSGILGMDLEGLSELAGRGKPASISSMCAVFAETEIIGLLARGVAPEDIAAGVFLSLARRIRTLAGRISLRGDCVFTGGLAQSSTFTRLLAAELGVSLHVPRQPQLTGALGAALIAAKLAANKEKKEEEK